MYSASSSQFRSRRGGQAPDRATTARSFLPREECAALYPTQMCSLTSNATVGINERPAVDDDGSASALAHHSSDRNRRAEERGAARRGAAGRLSLIHIS